MVSLKLSQFFPSSQASSPPPVGGVPVPVPFHVMVGPDGPIVPVAGSAANARNPRNAESAPKAKASPQRMMKIPDRPDAFVFMDVLLWLGSPANEFGRLAVAR